MKKLILMMVMLQSIHLVFADDVLSVEHVSIPQGGQGTLEVRCDFDTECTAFSFDLELPEHLTLLTDSDGELVYEIGFGGTLHQLQGTLLSNGSYRFSCISMDKEALPQNSVLLRTEVQVDESAVLGDTFTGCLTSIEFTTMNSTPLYLTDVTFDIEITDARIVLDEYSTTLPSDASSVDVRVRRTLKANEWSTIVLPFEMSAAQWKSIFGEDAHLMNFTGYVAAEDAAGDIASISVKFSEVAATAVFEANHPYVLKVTSDISEFTVDGVDIVVEEEPVVATVKRTRRQWSELIGTYVNNTEVPEKTLFLSGNKFWYSKGLTKMMGMRAYFDFYDVLTVVDESSVKAVMDFNDEPTAIVDLKTRTANNVYSVEGLYYGDNVDLDRLPKGIYIINGKKVFKNQ